MLGHCLGMDGEAWRLCGSGQAESRTTRSRVVPNGVEYSRAGTGRATRRMQLRGGGSLARAAAQETPVGDLLVSR